MKVTITELTRTVAGTYNQSGDMAPDLISHCIVRGDDGQLAVEISRDDLELWLDDEGFSRDHSFAGWGEVYVRYLADEDGGAAKEIWAVEVAE